MHTSVHHFINQFVTPSMIEGKKVLEVGSLDVNGSVRGSVMSLNPKDYIGIDFIDGNGVDEVLDARFLVDRFGKNSFDTVISTEMLEHAEDWRECVNQMKDITSDWLIITTRSPGFPLHSYPDDWWRYTVEDFEKIFKDFIIVTLQSDPQEGHPGVFMIARKTRKKRVDLSEIELTPAPKK